MDRFVVSTASNRSITDLTDPPFTQLEVVVAKTASDPSYNLTLCPLFTCRGYNVSMDNSIMLLSADTSRGSSRTTSRTCRTTLLERR